MKVAARPPIALVLMAALSCLAVATSCSFSTETPCDHTNPDAVSTDPDAVDDDDDDDDDDVVTSTDATTDDTSSGTTDETDFDEDTTEDGTDSTESTNDSGDTGGPDTAGDTSGDDDDVTEEPRDPSEMVLVPAGPFDRGVVTITSGHCDIVESGYKTIVLSSFEIDKTEVTVAAYRECVDSGTCLPAQTLLVPTPESCNFNVTDREDHPINCVDWYQATIYCAWAGKRLPTEAEWEKAARGTDRRVYPWGDDPVTCEHANYQNCVGSTTPVGSYPLGVSPYGALDMAGNLSEWVQDWLSEEYYDSSPLEDPQGPTDSFSDVYLWGYTRVLRGGSWSRSANCVRAAVRGANYPDSRASNRGFRCARSVDD